jgi:hypothetical protein
MVAGASDEVDGVRQVVGDADQTVEGLGAVVVVVVVVAAAVVAVAAAAVVVAAADVVVAAVVVVERLPVAVEEYSVDQDKDRRDLSEGARQAQDTDMDSCLVEMSLDLVDKGTLEDREERRTVEYILEDAWH